MTARTAAAERYAADEAEILALIEEADGQEAKQEVLKAAKKAAIRFQATAQATQAARIIARLTAVDEDQAANSAKKHIEDAPDLVDAVRYAASLDRVAKAVTKAARAARAAAPDTHEDAQALNSAQRTYNASQHARTQNTGDPITQDIEAAIAAERVAESEDQIAKAVQRLIDNATGPDQTQKRTAAQANITHLHTRVTHARTQITADQILDQAIHPAKFAVRAAQNLIDGTAATPTPATLDADTPATNAKVRDAECAIQGAGLAAEQAITDGSNQPYIKEYHGDRDEEYNMAIKAARDKADKAYSDGARQAAELERRLGETLKAIAESAKTDSLKTWLEAKAREIDRQAGTEACNLLDPDQRFQAHITVLRQAAIVLPKLARDIQAVCTASQGLAVFAGLNKKSSEIPETIKSVINEFTAKQAGGGNLVAQLTAGGNAATQLAEVTIALKGEIEVFIKQLRGDLGKLTTTEDQKEQMIKIAVKDVLEQVDQARANAKAANQNFGIQDQAVVLREASLKARANVIISSMKIDKTVTEMAQKMDAAVEATIKLHELTGPQLIEAYDRYVGSSNPAEQAERKKIEAFIDDEANGVHYYYRNQLLLRKALRAALCDNYHGKEVDGEKIPGAYEHLNHLTAETEFHKTEQGALREALEHSVVDAIRHAIAMVRFEGMGNNLMLPILVEAIQELAKRSRNLKLAAKAANPETTPAEAKKYLKDIEVQPPDPDTEGGKTEAKDVGLDKNFVTYERKGPRQWDLKGRPGRRKKVQTFDFKALERMNPAEKAEYANKVSETLLVSANALFDKMLDNLDTEQRFLMEQKRGEWIDKQHERLLKLHDRSETMQFQLHKLLLFRKEMNRQRWKDAMVQWAFLWLKGAVESGSKSVNTFMSEFEKIIMKVLT